MGFISKIIVNILTTCVAIISSNKCQGVHIQVGSSLFSDVVKSDAFVDKTMFLIEFFQEPSITLITAPRGFGKSTNLNMLKSFLSIEIGEYDTPREQKETKNYQLFKENKLAVFEQEYGFFASYFAKFPVVAVNFRTNDSVTNYEEAFRICKQKIHESFKEHIYLTNSIFLNVKEKKTFQLWCEDKSYHDINEHDVRWGLYNLTQFLSIHFGKDVFLLVDDYDSLIMQAVFSVGNRPNNVALNNTAKLITDILTNVLNDNPFLENAILTGVFKLSDAILPNVSDLWWYGFLNDHPFSDFYGFTRKEVETLFNSSKFSLDRNVVIKAHKKYDGYTGQSGEHIYCPYSVLRFLQTSKVANYWTKTGRLEDSRFLDVEFFKVSNISSRISAMLRGETATVDYFEDVSVKDVMDLKRILSDKRIERSADVDLYFSFLFQQGYLSFVEPLAVDDIKLPNKEIEQVFAKIMSHH